MQSYPKTAEKKGLCLWKAQSTASDISPEWRERTQCSLASVLPANFPSSTQEKHCSSAPLWSHITEEPPTPSIPSRRSPEFRKSSKFLTLALFRVQTKTRERKKTQAHWEGGSSKYKLKRRNLHTVHLQSGTSTLYSPSLAPRKDVFCVIHQSWLWIKLPGVLSLTPYSSPHSWKPPWLGGHTRDTTFTPGIQPARNLDGTTTR